MTNRVHVDMTDGGSCRAVLKRPGKGGGGYLGSARKTDPLAMSSMSTARDEMPGDPD